MTRKRLKSKLDLGLNEVGYGGVMGAAGGLAVFEGLAHMGTAGLVWAAAIAVVGGLNGKLIADGGKFVAEKMLVNPPSALAQRTFGITSGLARQNTEEVRGNSEVSSPTNTINIGIDKRRRDFERTMYQFKGILILGLPGMGKTTTVSTIASLIVERGARLTIIDIKARLDDSLAGLLSPFEAAFTQAPAWKPEGILEAAEYADELLEKRINKEETDLYPYYLVVDEFTDLMMSAGSKSSKYNEAACKVAEVVQRINVVGRSLNVFTFAVGQIANADKSGGTSIRETFATKIIHGMKEYQASIIAPKEKEIIAKLDVGEALVVMEGKEDPAVVCIRQISNEEKRRIASGIVPFGSNKETRVLPEVELPDLEYAGADSKETRRLPEEEMVEIGKDNGPGKTPIYTTKANIDFLVAAARAGKPISQSIIQAALGCTEAISKNVSRMVGEIASRAEEGSLSN